MEINESIVLLLNILVPWSKTTSSMGTVAPSITVAGIHVLGSTKEKLAGNILVDIPETWRTIL